MSHHYLDSPGRRGARRFTDEHLLQIAMPMGGIGGGSICLNGHGGLQDFAIRHQPALTAVPDGHGVVPSGFATLYTQATSTAPTTARLLEGPLPRGKIYDQGLQGQGYRNVAHAGLPRFAHCAFESMYPSGTIHLHDETVPLTATLTGWSPLIPLDDHHSSLPCAIVEYRLHNRGPEAVRYALGFHLMNLTVGRGGYARTRSGVLPGRGVLMSTTLPADDPGFATASLTCVGHQPSAIKAMWLRGQWFDWIMALWREISGGALAANPGLDHGAPDQDGVNGSSIELAGTLSPGAHVTYPIVLTWHFPNVDQFVGQPPTAPAPTCDTASGCCPPPAPPQPWHPYYAAHWRDAAAVADTVHTKYQELRRKTFAFRDALHSSTLPETALDAIASNLAILKSPTLLRQANGNLWGWEGCFAQRGCCHGTCTHVWNYAQALPHLFPALERTLREQELLRSMDDQGHVAFRAALPDGPTRHDHHAAADGQLGGIMKVYRDWQITGDDRWLRSIYPQVRRSMEFCIRQWDPDRRGALFEPHHNTYDVEFWGPDGMCTTVYVGALSAVAALAGHLGEAEATAEYHALARRGADFLATHLFNGDYYQQEVQWRELRDASFRDLLARSPADGEAERAALLRREGPPYQYGAGCLSDGVIGAWMADLYGIEHPMDTGQVRQTLRAIHTHNFKPDLWDHACLQRAGYALGHEAGLLTCTWPRGQRPVIPFPYCDEVFTGIEYQVASHLILHGEVERGLAMVRGVRSRYEGATRNPFNEYECGNFYARALASYALLQALSGFRYSAVTRTLWFAPRTEARPFHSFFCTASGYGVITLTGHELTVAMLDGELRVDAVVVGRAATSEPMVCDGVATVEQPWTVRWSDHG